MSYAKCYRVHVNFIINGGMFTVKCGVTEPNCTVPLLSLFLSVKLCGCP